MTWYSETKQTRGLILTVIGKGIPFACDPRNPERSAIEAGTIRIGKDLAGAIALLLLGVLALGKKGVRH